jgi:hypothetical protein
LDVEITDIYSRLPKKFSGMYLQPRLEMQSKKFFKISSEV